MQETLLRLGIVLLVGILAWLLVRIGKNFVEKQRQRALVAAPLATQTTASDQAAEQMVSPVRILAFSSEDCRQCHQLQAPALQRVLSARGEAVEVVEVDATTDTTLVQAYHILTVPSTVILDATGQAQAVNYGFANTQRLLQQIDDVLTKTATSLSA